MAIDDVKLERALKALEEINADPELERYINYKMIDDAYYASLQNDAKKAGQAEGFKEGIEEGIEKGIEKGIETVVKNMLSQNIDIDIISKSTGLSVDEIEKYKK